MSYRDAVKCFAENKHLIEPPTSDALQWNLANGLSNLAQALERDMAALDVRLQNIEKLLRGR